MARFDPNTYPDRLAFEAHARRIRAQEIDKTFGAAAAWLHDRERELASRVARIGAAAVGHRSSHPAR